MKIGMRHLHHFLHSPKHTKWYLSHCIKRTIPWQFKSLENTQVYIAIKLYYICSHHHHQWKYGRTKPIISSYQMMDVNQTYYSLVGRTILIKNLCVLFAHFLTLNAYKYCVWAVFLHLRFIDLIGVYFEISCISFKREPCILFHCSFSKTISY